MTASDKSFSYGPDGLSSLIRAFRAFRVFCGFGFNDLNHGIHGIHGIQVNGPFTFLKEDFQWISSHR
jgi:hypothetical protein